MCLIFFPHCRKLWLEVPGWFGQGSAPRLVCTTLKTEEHPDEILRYLPMKNQLRIPSFFKLFLKKLKNERRRKTFLEYPPPTIIQKRTAVLMDLCLEKRSKQKEHDFHQLISPPTRIFAIFSRITIKKNSEQVTVIVSIKTRKNKKPVRKLQNTHFFFGLKNHHYRVSKHFLVIYFHAIFSLP